MYRMIKQAMAGVAFAALWTGAIAASRPLPELGLVDERGLAVGRERLEQEHRWVLVVVDAARPLTRPMLAMLDKANGGWDDALTIVVLGDDTAAAQIDDLQRRLTGVRWYRSAESHLAQHLKVPGVPVILGIDANRQIAWQAPGLPRSAEELQAKLRDWLSAPPELK